MAMVGAAGALVLSEMGGGSELARAALRRPERCAAVEQVQRELARRSYAVGPLDGIFGAKTEFAVRRFQADRGLSVTGQVGNATASALQLPASLGCGSVVGTANYRVATPGAVLNRRRQPNGVILDRLAHDTPVRVVETSGNWSRLQRGGWVANAYLVRTTSVLNPDASSIANGSGGSGGSGGGTGNNLYIPSSNGVSVEGTSPSGNATACNHTALVSPGRLNVRNAPAGEVVSSVEQGEAICLTGEGRASDRRFWARLQGGNWVAADFLRLLN